MKFVDHKKQLSKFLLPPDLSVTPIGESVRVKTVINLVPDIGQYLHVN
jgi:hypothetical protein